MIVCICQHVSDRELAKLAKAGLGFDEIQFETGVSTQCGKCEDCARAVVARRQTLAEAAPASVLHPIRIHRTPQPPAHFALSAA